MFYSPELGSSHAELRGHSVPCDELGKRHKFDPIVHHSIPVIRKDPGLQQQPRRPDNGQAQAQSRQM